MTIRDIHDHCSNILNNANFKIIRNVITGFETVYTGRYYSMSYEQHIKDVLWFKINGDDDVTVCI